MRIVTLLTMLFPVGGVITALQAATMDVHQADLPIFESGDGTYYRLPSILVSHKGTVLAACQKRKGSRGDWAESALVLKRSTDGGQTWGPEQTLCERPGYSVFNGNLIEDRQTGQVLATFIVFPKHAGAGWFLNTWIPAGGHIRPALGELPAGQDLVELGLQVFDEKSEAEKLPRRTQIRKDRLSYGYRGTGQSSRSCRPV